VNAIEAGDQIEAAVGGDRVDARIVEGDVARARRRGVGARALERVSGNVVAVEIGLRVGLGHFD